MTFGRTSYINMFKRSEEMITDNDCRVPAKRAKFDSTRGDPHCSKEKEFSKNQNVQYDDLWGDDFAQEDLEEMDLIASQAGLQESNALDNLKLFESHLHSTKTEIPEVPTTATTACNKITPLKLPLPTEKSDIWMRKAIQGSSCNSQDITQIDYTQFRNKLINCKNHNSTFIKTNNFIIADDKELERLKNENKKLLNDFITKDGETVFLRQQLQQIQLRAENEKLEKMRLIEEQANRHRSEINNICKEKEQLKTQLELQNLEIRNLMERCKVLESGNIKLKEPQSVYINTVINKNKCTTPIKWNATKTKEVCVQVNRHKESDYQLKTWTTYFPLARISELMLGISLPEKPIVSIRVIEKTGRRNLPILQEEETFRIFENPDLVKPTITIVDGKRLTTEFVLLEIAAIERKINAEIESETCIPIINKLVLTARELMLNVVMALQTIFQAMRNDDIRDMNDLYFSTVYQNHNVCIKSECEADAWYEGEHGIEARRLLGVLSHISLESLYLSNYLAGKSPLLIRDDKCYNHYLQQMTRYNAWPKKGRAFEMLEIIMECVTLIGRVRRSHQFTGLINAIVKILCNVQEKTGYCDKGLEYVCFIFKELVFSRPLSLCYVSLAQLIMVFSKCNAFVPKLCRSSQSMTIKRWKGTLHFTPDACVLQILMAQMQHFHSDFFTTINITHALISSVQYILRANNDLLKSDCSESCNCYIKLVRFTINMLKKCSEIRLDIRDTIEWQDSFYISKKCYTLKKIDYKNYARRTNHDMQRKHSPETYPDKLDRNFWSGVKKVQHKVLREGIRFLCYLAICDPDFVIRSSDIEDSFHLFIRNISFFNELILHENEQEALDRIKTTFIVDKGLQSDVGKRQKNTRANQLSMTNFKKKIIPATKSQMGPVENFSRVHMSIKALYNSKTECRDD